MTTRGTLTPRAAVRQLLTVLEPQDLRQFGIVFLAMLTSAVMSVGGVASIMPFMQLATNPGAIAEHRWLHAVYVTFAFESPRQMMLWVAAGVFALFLGSVAISAWTGWLIQRRVWATTHRLCLRQLRAYLQLPYEFFLVNSSAELLRRTVSDISTLSQEVLLAGTRLLAQAMLVLGLLLLTLVVNPLWTLLAFGAIGSIYALLHIVRHGYLVKLGQTRIEADRRRYRTFVEPILGMKAIRVANATAHFLERFALASRSFTELFPRLELVTNLPRYVIELFAYGGILLLVLHVTADEQQLVDAIPMLSLFALAAYRLLPALHAVFDCAARISNSFAAIESVARDLQTEGAGDQPTTASAAGLTFARELHLRDITFRYGSASTPALDAIDIRIRKGEHVAFVGSTGSGKTTLVDIVVGLLVPAEGSLELDGRPLGRAELRRWRDLLAYVPQDVFLLDDSIARNIAFGFETIDRERLRTAAQAAQLRAFVETELPQGWDTVVGERGVRLSGGQRQRIGLARAIYRRPQVLILDEATSALDSVTEAAFTAAIGAALPGVTMITVAHRLSTVQNCDCIHLIEKGRLVASGTYDVLAAGNATFRAMADSFVRK